MMEKLPDNIYQVIMDNLLSLEKNPRPFGCRKLSGAVEKYRIRIGDYRAIYKIKDNILTVEVVKVGHRSSVYR
ncbi:type II toxin-antitoxin system RelE family toxin [Candidatus Symbiothrix dinenymphae]|uniref:type II toxin-antitoxin system RelE family toxin n=1 Tax=Candidatus Symbiothrix dinenymphae TaxID=467085 RepID=UPI0021CDAF4C|nr:type II toxin-antitoxin system RelE/ParE family toxin [Candidatus Symbiothrix dinenymphae]